MSDEALSRREFLITSGTLLCATAVPAWADVFQAGSVDDALRVEIAETALGRAAALGASYADIRVNRYRRESIATRERQVQNVSRSTSRGFGLRVLVNGAWGFAAGPDVQPAAVRRITDQAIEIAKANAAYQRKSIALVPTPRVSATWRGAFDQDPFEIAADRKIEFLLAMNEAAAKAKGASFVKSSLSFQNEQKFFASTEGTRTDQYIIRTHPTLTVTAVNRKTGDFQSRRSLPGPKCIGYEYLERYPWLKEAEQTGVEAVAKLDAKPVVPDV